MIARARARLNTPGAESSRMVAGRVAPDRCRLYSRRAPEVGGRTYTDVRGPGRGGQGGRRSPRRARACRRASRPRRRTVASSRRTVLTHAGPRAILAVHRAFVPACIPDRRRSSMNTAYGFDGSGYNVGDRVEIHPGTDLWMRGARYGTVIGISFTPADRVRVEMDKLPGTRVCGHEDTFRRVSA